MKTNQTTHKQLRRAAKTYSRQFSRRRWNESRTKQPFRVWSGRCKG